MRAAVQVRVFVLRRALAALAATALGCDGASVVGGADGGRRDAGAIEARRDAPIVDAPIATADDVRPAEIGRA
ncbi:MAG: hypothetical protein JWM10_4294, partial [Myxococcaceae bacterium]|nr:hypothetical protein [Myxococcaceae bacterium]